MQAVPAESNNERPRRSPRRPTPEQRLERIASGAHGIVTRAEAGAAGVSRAEIEHRLRVGALIREHQGVFRLGHRAPSHAARYMAAVKACGDGAALSGLAAAHWLSLLAAAPEVVEVTAPTLHRVPGLLVHRAQPPLQRTISQRIPVTTPARTLTDIAARLDDDVLGYACHQAWVRHRCGLPQINAVLRHRPRAPGRRRLLRMVQGEDPLVLSRMERRFLWLLRGDGRELPASNVRVGKHCVDYHWPHLHLIVELDSYTFHGSRRAWERDRERDRDARRRGDELLRYVYEDVFHRYEEMLAELRQRIPDA